MGAGTQRLLIVQLLQLGALLFAVVLGTSSAVLIAAVLGASVAVLGTDSGWRRRNVLLLLQAGCWLLAAMLVAGWSLWGSSTPA